MHIYIYNKFQEPVYICPTHLASIPSIDPIKKGHNDNCTIPLQTKKHHCMIFFHETTLPETNIAPENGWLEY